MMLRRFGLTAASAAAFSLMAIAATDTIKVEGGAVSGLASADHRLADQMSSYWVNFIMTGDPNGKTLPKWTPYDPDAEPFLEFGDVIRSGNHLFKAELDFLEKFQSRP